jgi:hypothetical protein
MTDRMMATNSAILLVTGSRAYPGGIRVYEMVAEVLNDFAHRNYGRDLVLIHGDCPHPKRSEQNALSIDQVAAGVGSRTGYRVVPMPVDHTVDGSWPVAGPRRNARMVRYVTEQRDQHGAIVEYAAWPWGESKGTHGCIKECQRSRIPGKVFGVLK